MGAKPPQVPIAEDESQRECGVWQPRLIATPFLSHNLAVAQTTTTPE